MKRILFILTLLVCGFISQAQNPIPTDSVFAIKQSVANAPTTLGLTNVLQAKKGFINGVFADTTAANLYSTTTGGYRLKYYPGAQIFTPSDNKFWLRNNTATKWLDATSGEGGSSITNLNDSTIIVCNAAGSCDTISLGNSDTYYFITIGDTATAAVSCDTVVVTCVGDSCYQTQLCDTTLIPGAIPFPTTFYQNLLWENDNRVEAGDPLFGLQAQMLHDTYFNLGGYQLTIKGAAVSRPPLYVQQFQWTSESPAITSFNHTGSYPNTGLIDSANAVALTIGYANPIPVVSADTIGMFGATDIGYYLSVNAPGQRYSVGYENALGKQNGILLHTLDTGNTKGVSIFTQQLASAYCFSCNPQVDSTFESKIAAVFHTNQDVQFPNYPNTRNDGVANKAIIPLDTDGNLGVGSVIASTSIVEIISDTSFRVCDLEGVCDTFVVDITDPSVINIFNDTTIIICNEAGSCDTITVNNYTITNGQVVNIANTVFVAKSGNDGTGVRQRLDLPFLTIRAALTAAFPRDVIVVFPGTYEEINPLSLHDSVNFHFIGKGTVQLVTSLASSPIFTDSNLNAVSVIDGEGWTFEARSTQNVLLQTAPSNVTFIADRIISSNGMTLRIVDSATTNVKANRLYGNAFSGQIWVDSALSFTASIDLIESGPFGNALWTRNTSDIQVYAKRIIADPTNDDYLVYFFDTQAGDSIYLQADELRAGTEWAIWAKGLSPAMFIHAKSIVANSDCVVTSSTSPGGMLYVEANVIESTTTGTLDGIIHGEGGSLTVTGAWLKRNIAATGNDIRTVNFGGDDGYVYLNSVVYDKTKVDESPIGTIKRIDRDFYGSDYVANFTNKTTAANTANPTIVIDRQTSGTALAGLGAEVDFQLQSSTTVSQLSNYLTSRWSDPTHATRTSQFIIGGTNSGTPQDLAYLEGVGSWQWLKYGDGLFTAGTETYLLAVTAAGNVIEFPAGGLPGGGALITADNGLTMSTVTNVQLGGTLLHNTTIDGSTSYNLRITGDYTTATNNAVLDVNNASTSGVFVAIRGTAQGSANTGVGVNGSTSGGYGVQGSSTTGTAGRFDASTTGVGVVGASSSGTGVWGVSTTGKAGYMVVAPSSTNTIVDVFQLDRQTSATAANGIGGGLTLSAEEDAGSSFEVASIDWKWVNAVSASRTGQLDFIVTNSTAANTIMSAYGTGVVGIGISSAYTATRLDIVDNTATTQDISSITSTSLSSGNALNISVASTAATGNTQKGINLTTSGANANAGQTTYGIYAINGHTGSVPTNIGVYGEAGGGTTNRGVMGLGGSTAGSVGVRGESLGSSGTGVQGFAGSGTGGRGVFGAHTTNGAYAIEGQTSTASTNSVITNYRLSSLTDGTAAAGLGGSFDFYTEVSDNTAQLSNQITSHWTNATITTQTSTLTLKGVLAAATVDLLTLAGDGSVKLRPITSTAASAITPAEGMLVFVSDTDGTFVSIGIWCYQNGAWKAL
jgi:hypothetical protein